MSTWKKIRKVVKNATRKVAPIVTGGMYNPGAKAEEEPGTRSEAAAQLIKQNTNKQAGGAQISYGEEKYV